MVSPTASLAILIFSASIVCRGSVEGRESRIIDGQLAEPNQFPYAVALIDDQIGFFCSGSIIHPSWVLTAAHCISDKVNTSNNVHVITSTIDFNYPGNEYTAEKLFVLPNYKPEKNSEGKLINKSRDLGLIKIREQFRELPIPIGNDPLMNSPVAVIGFGATYPGDIFNTRLKFAITNIKGKAEYEDQFRCEYVDGVACRGDSGGPVVSAEGTQFAVTSASDFKISTYVTIISVYKDWVNKIIATYS